MLSQTGKFFVVYEYMDGEEENGCDGEDTVQDQDDRVLIQDHAQQAADKAENA